MAYSYGPPPGAYNPRQPPYSYTGPPPNLGPPPPGMDGAPGISAQSPTTPSHPQQFQPPPNMPNINFNAPVIRLGVGGEQQNPGAPADRLAGGRDGFRGSNAEPLGRRDRLGLGAERGDGRDGGGRNLERDRAAVRESMMALQPPTREEVARTIFIGGLGDGAPSDSAVEELLRCAGKLRRWTRARDADDEVCRFGFAEYEDVDSLEAANEIFADGVEVPMFKKGSVLKDEDSGEVKKMKLLVVVDDQSKAYIDEWKGRRREDEDARQFRIDGCKEDLRQNLASLTNARAFLANGDPSNTDVAMSDGVNGTGENGEKAEVVTIPVALEDELSDIPADMRATVAEEIKAFRERSTKRDLERLRREEELEQAERQRSSTASRINRLASPPPSSAPSGPASAANGIPVGPRAAAQSVPNAPSGPRGYRGAQLPSDYVNGVNFVGANGTTNGMSLSREDEEDPASDEELERRRKERRDEEMQREFERVENRWLRREATRAAAQDREKAREAGEERVVQTRKMEAKKRFEELDDEGEEMKVDGGEEFYVDRTTWLRKRQVIRETEGHGDAHDREEEAREKAEDRRRTAEARGMADDFMNSMSDELSSRPGSSQPTTAAASGVKISLGAARSRATLAAAATAASAPQKRGMADAEGLLEDEEAEALASGVLARPELKPLPPTSSLPSAPLTDEEIADGRKALAASIPTSADELFATKLKQEYLTSEIMDTQIRPFVEKKIVEYLGVQEDLLVDAVVDGIKDGKGGEDLVGVLEEVFDKEEAVALVRRVWRLGVFWGECAARGLGGV